MLSVAENHLRELNPSARLEVFGQEWNPETYAVCRSDMMIKGQDASHIACGNSFSSDGHRGQTFDYLLANPPFGVEWKNVERVIREERDKLGFRGRFGAGLPRINDGSLLFLQHMIAKMKPPEQGGSRLAIVFNGSPLFSGSAGSGESEIRRWIIEHDWLEAVVALPDQLFYNTGIFTYFWVLTNRKRPIRKGQVQLVDARELWTKMRKSMGEKRKALSEEQIAEVTRLYAGFDEGERVRIFPNSAFGFQRITVERPLRLRYEVTAATLPALAESKAWAKVGVLERADLEQRLKDLEGQMTTDRRVMARKIGSVPTRLDKAVWEAVSVTDPEAPVFTTRKGKPEPDPELRDNEDVPLPEGAVTWELDPTERLGSLEYRAAVDGYMAAEVLPYVPDAWVDHGKTRIGYEIPLTRHFYKYVAPRPLAETDSEILSLQSETQRLLGEAAVAGRLTPAGPRRSTAVPWLVDIPAHWSEGLLKFVAKLGSGHTPSRDHPEWWVNPTVPWITTGEVSRLRDDRVEYITETRECISELGMANSSATLHPAGTVVLCRTASAGYSGIMASDMATSQDFATWTCGPLLRPRFLLLCLRAMRQDLLGRLAMGSTHQTIYMPDIESIKVPLPPVDEQDAIVNAVYTRLGQLDVALTALGDQVRLLLERRQALITAAVTGELDLPETGA